VSWWSSRRPGSSRGGPRRPAFRPGVLARAGSEGAPYASRRVGQVFHHLPAFARPGRLAWGPGTSEVGKGPAAGSPVSAVAVGQPGCRAGTSTSQVAAAQRPGLPPGPDRGSVCLGISGARPCVAGAGESARAPVSSRSPPATAPCDWRRNVPEAPCPRVILRATGQGVKNRRPSDNVQRGGDRFQDVLTGPRLVPVPLNCHCPKPLTIAGTPVHRRGERQGS